MLAGLTPAKAHIPAQRALDPVASAGPKTPPAAPSAGAWKLLQRITVVCGACVAVLGLLEIVAWQWHWTTPLRVQPSYTAMQFNVALALAATGGAIVLAAYRRTAGVRAVGFADLLLGTATLAQTVFGWNLRIDQVFTHAYVGTPGQHPGRMAADTAVCLLLVGAGLLNWRPEMGRRRAAALTGAGSAAAAIALIVLVGYLAGIPSFYGWASLKPMAPPTAFGVLVTAAGLLAMSRAAGPRPGRPLADGIAVSAGIVAFAGTTLLWQSVVDTGAATLSGGEASRAILALAALAGVLVSIAAGLGERAARGRRIAEQVSNRLSAEVHLRRTAEAAARDSQQLIARFVDALPVAVLVTAPGGDPYLVNRTASQLLGREAVGVASAGYLGEAYGTFVAGTQQPYPSERSPSLRALAGETFHVDDIDLHRPDGKVVPVEAWGTPVFDSNGQVQYGIAAFADISQRRQSERSLAERADLLDLASDAIYIRDSQHRVTYWNAGAEALFGWTHAEADGQHCQLLLRTEFPTPFDDSEASLIRDDHCERQLVQYNKAGKRLDVDSRWSARYGPDGALSSVLVINTDVTARRAAECQATERAAELGALNSELNRSNAELGQFAYIASHDLAEPLRAISGPVSLLARRYQGQLDPDADRFIEFAVDGCQRMQTLIDDLLTFSRTGRVDGPPVAIDTNDLLARVLADLTPSIEARHAHVTVDELPPVRGDTTQLRQLFQNLIANAVKFTPAGAEPRIHIGGNPANGQNTFTITDNGIGIDARHRERVFGMFKRLHSRDEYPGTGIGLALCKKIVEHHHGTIDVADGPGGVGCTFTVILPTVPEHTP